MIDPESPSDAVRVAPRTLRQFAALWLGVFAGLFTLSAYQHGAPGLAAWTALAAGVLVGVPGLVRPLAIGPVWLASVALTRPVGHAVAIVMLAAVYFGVLTPIAVVLRRLGHDALRLRRPVGETYWLEVRQPLDAREYLRQYRAQ